MNHPKKPKRGDITKSRITVQLPESLIKAIKMKSVENNRTIKETCKEALKEYLKKN